MLGALVAVAASACLGTGPALQERPAPHSQALSERAWLAGFAAREAAALGDPMVTTALVAPVTADQARVVFQHRRRAYPGHSYLVVLRGSFVSPRVPCPADAWGCPGYVPTSVWLADNAGPGGHWAVHGGISASRPTRRICAPCLWRCGGSPSRPLPGSGQQVPLLRFAVAQANGMGGSQMRGFGFARLSTAQASHLFGGSRPSGYLVIEHGLFRRTPGARADRDPWFWWAAFEYSPPLGQRPAAFRVLAHPRRFVRRVAGVHLSWQGVPFLA